MAVEYTIDSPLPVQLFTRMQRSVSTMVAQKERPHKAPASLPFIESTGFPQHEDRIRVANTLLAGTYGVTLMYDELCRKALRKTKKKSPSQEIYHLVRFQQDIDEIVDYSGNITQLAMGYVGGQETQELESAVRKKTNDVFTQTSQEKEPPTQEKKIDGQLGMERALLSEALGVQIQVHDIRNALTIFKMLAQQRGRRNILLIGEDLQALIAPHKHVGEKAREKLLDPVQTYPQGAYSIQKLLKKFATQEEFEQKAKGWNITFADTLPSDLPAVRFNEQVLYSIFENVLLNAQKARALLEEEFNAMMLAYVFTNLSRRLQTRGGVHMQGVYERLTEAPEIMIDFAQVQMRRKRYLEIIFRDNGIGNDHNDTRKTWKKRFSMGNSDWSSSRNVSGTGIVMAAHRQRIRELFPHTHADMYLRQRSDGKKGAEMVLRLPENTR